MRINNSNTLKPARLPGRMEIVDPVMAKFLQNKTEAERLRIAWGMWRSARDMLTNLAKAEHPEWSDDKVQWEVARRLAHGAK